ncbi:hypothetical protein DFH09DRAFT_1353371 [Mycena vulgaris]|nr:hypothetical protein DFH09DRAFT_1353371 [Mycena vulgaris]
MSIVNEPTIAVTTAARAPDPNKWREREAFSASSNLPAGSRIRMLFPLDLYTATRRPSSIVSHTSAASTSALKRTLKMWPVLLLNYRFGVVKGKEVVEVLALSEATFEDVVPETYLNQAPASVFQGQGVSLVGDLLLPVYCAETSGLPQRWERTMRRLPQITYSTANDVDFSLPGRVWMVRFLRQIRFPATLAFYQQSEANANLFADAMSVENAIKYSFNGTQMISAFLGESGSGPGSGTDGASTGEGPDKQDGAGKGGTKEEDSGAEGGGGEEEGARGTSSSTGGSGTGGQAPTSGTSFGAWMFPNNIPADLILPVVDVTEYSFEDAEEEDRVDDNSVYCAGFQRFNKPALHPCNLSSSASSDLKGLPPKRSVVHPPKSIINLDESGQERSCHRRAPEKATDFTLIMISLIACSKL